MNRINRSPRALLTKVVLVLCAAMVTDLALAAPTLESIAVSPTAPSISVGQAQGFTATGTFSDHSTQSLGPAIANMAAAGWTTCALLTSGGVECWGNNADGELGDGSTTNSLIPRPVKGITSAMAVAHGGVMAVRCWPMARSGAGAVTTGANWAMGPPARRLLRSRSAGSARLPPWP